MKYKNLIFDFDGVLAESNEIRFNGFRRLFQEYPLSQVEELVAYAKANGGVSRYEKIRYFFQEVRGEPIMEERVQVLAARFSDLVRQEVVDAEPVKGSVVFLKQKLFRNLETPTNGLSQLSPTAKELKNDTRLPFKSDWKN